MKPASVFPAVLILLLTCGAVSAQQSPASNPVVLRQVVADIYMTAGGRGAQGGVYIGEKEVLLIDSKQDSASVAREFAEIRKLTSNPVTRLVNTHADGDHVFGNRFLPPGVTVIAHENCLKEFFVSGMSGAPSDWSRPELNPFLPSVTFKDSMDILMGSKKIQLRYFGVGHTTGDTVVYFPDEKVAFVGDQMFVGRPPLIHAYKGGSALGNVANLEKMLAALPAEQFVCGHNDIQDRAGIQKFIAAMKAMQKKVRDLKGKGLTVEDVRKEFAPNEANLVGIIYNEVK